MKIVKNIVYGFIKDFQIHIYKLSVFKDVSCGGGGQFDDDWNEYTTWMGIVDSRKCFHNVDCAQKQLKQQLREERNRKIPSLRNDICGLEQQLNLLRRQLETLQKEQDIINIYEDNELKESYEIKKVGQ